MKIVVYKPNYPPREDEHVTCALLGEHGYARMHSITPGSMTSVQRRNQGGAHWAFAPPVSFEGALEANAAPVHEKDLQAPKAPANPFRM